MNDIFNVINKAGDGAWIIAESEEAATAIAKKARHIKSTPKSVVHQPLEGWKSDTAFASLQGLVTSGTTGRIRKVGTPLTFATATGAHKIKPGQAPAWAFV